MAKGSQFYAAIASQSEGEQKILDDKRRLRRELTARPIEEKLRILDAFAWLNLIRDHIATSLSIEPNDFDYAPFSQRGGLGKAHQLFGDKLLPLLDELNQTLAA
jgi:hypothetical protein